MKMSLQRTLPGDGSAVSLFDFHKHFGLSEANLISMVTAALQFYVDFRAVSTTRPEEKPLKGFPT